MQPLQSRGGLSIKAPPLSHCVTSVQSFTPLDLHFCICKVGIKPLQMMEGNGTGSVSGPVSVNPNPAAGKEDNSGAHLFAAFQPRRSCMQHSGTYGYMWICVCM